MKKYGKDINSTEAWDNMAKEYTSQLVNLYHKHRMVVIDSLIPRELYKVNTRIMDFGCGDAVHFEQFVRTGCSITGVDISRDMIDLAKKRLSELNINPGSVKVGGVESLKENKSCSLDAVLSFNVLAYLSDDEIDTFYKEVYRLLRPGGYLIVTHSNELFDMFSMNQYTIDFIKKHLLIGDEFINLLDPLINKPMINQLIPTYNVRENPLSYKFKLDRYGFTELQQEFINLHNAPPRFLVDGKSYPDTLNWKAEEKWKLMFTCSTYGSLSIRKEN
jgi:SAM-dependent methyltransferase